VTPLDAQPDPPSLTALKAEVTATWPMTSLLDMVIEADLRLNFTGTPRSPTAHETLDRAVLQPRLLLCLHGIGTNAGLQRIAGRESGVTYKDLAYVRRRYLSVEARRRAVAVVTNGTLRVRDSAIWGDGTTACASDSKQFGAWDQNLTTQWLVGYWELILRQYDQMVKYATAVRLGTAETEASLRRFTRNNVQHPTYKAFAELGKAVKTIFLCRYLQDEGLRREIH
jgi:hypothetical protein